MPFYAFFCITAFQRCSPYNVIHRTRHTAVIIGDRCLLRNCVHRLYFKLFVYDEHAVVRNKQILRQILPAKAKKDRNKSIIIDSHHKSVYNDEKFRKADSVGRQHRRRRTAEEPKEEYV